MTNHIFLEELKRLEREPPIGNFFLLIVGSFNAAIKNNNAEWFYDRPNNEFWFLLPKMIGDDSLHELDNNIPYRVRSGEPRQNLGT